MKKVAAATAAILGLTLTATAAFAATAHPTNHGSAVSALARDHSAVGGPQSNHGGAVSTLAKTDAGQAPTVTTPDPTVHSGAGAQGSHGAAVSKVAQDKTAVGGPHKNHGGAVSAVARGSHGPSGTQGKGHGKS